MDVYPQLLRKKNEKLFLREKIDITCETSDQAEYRALGRLILRVNQLLKASIIPKNSIIHLCSDNVSAVEAIKNGRGVKGLQIDFIDDALAQFQILMCHNLEVKLYWIKRTKNKEAHPYLYNKKHLRRHLVEIIPEVIKFEYF